MKKLIFIVVFFLVSVISFSQNINCEVSPKYGFFATYLITPNNKEIIDEMIKVDCDNVYEGKDLNIRNDIYYNDSTKTLYIKNYAKEMLLNESQINNAAYNKEYVYDDNDKNNYIIKYTFYFYCANKEFKGYKIPVLIICSPNDLTKTNKSAVNTYINIKPITPIEYKISSDLKAVL